MKSLGRPGACAEGSLLCRRVSFAQGRAGDKYQRAWLFLGPEFQRRTPGPTPPKRPNSGAPGDPERTLQWLHEQADAESGDAVRTGLPQAPRELETVAFKGVVSRPLREGGLREERSSGGPGARQRELPTPVPGPQIRSEASLSWARESGPTTSTHPQGFVSALSPSKNRTVYVLNLLTGEQGLPGPTAPRHRQQQQNRIAALPPGMTSGQTGF